MARLNVLHEYGEELERRIRLQTFLFKQLFSHNIYMTFATPFIGSNGRKRR